MRTEGKGKPSSRAGRSMAWGRRAIGIGALLAIGTIGYAIWGAWQQLRHLPSVGVASGVPAVDIVVPETSREGQQPARAEEPARLPVNPPVVRADPVRERFQKTDTYAAAAWDESPDDRASLQGLLDDPDPDVRAEAAALLEILDAELALSPP
jgi:hypothetical protein